MKLASEFSPKYAGISELPGRKRGNFPEIVDPLFWEAYENASRFSLVHVTGFYNLFQSLNYICRSRLPGDMVECGCFLGGVGIFMALLRDHLAMKEKTIYLFDSFEGFPAGEEDAMLGRSVKSSRYKDIEQEVRDNIKHAAPGCGRIELIRGFVESTIPKFPSPPLCLLRLDTDFYKSTKVELAALYDRLVVGGVLIIDDYGLFEGSRRATDEFFLTHDDPPLLNRIDKGVWAGVKPCPSKPIAGPLVRAVLPVALLASFMIPAHQALAGRETEVFVSPSAHLSLQPLVPSSPLYGHDVRIARWHLGQWNNPDGNLPDLLNGNSRSDSLSLSIDNGPPVSYVITQSGKNLPCSDSGRVTEFDGFIGTNTSHRDSDAPSARVNVGQQPDLSRYTSLTQTISLTVQASGLIEQRPRCIVSNALSLVCIVLSNVRLRSTLFYQMVLYAFGTTPRSTWWALGTHNGRFGYNDPMSAFGEPMASPGRPARYEINILPRLRRLIETNAVGADSDMRDWQISGAYYGNAIWGDVQVSTKWQDYRLTGASSDR